MHGTLRWKPGLRLSRPLTSDDLAAIEELACAEARQYFPAFRRWMHPEMLWGWFVEDVSWELQEFFGAFCRGERPKIILMSPPQHGKSSVVEDFLAWVAGRMPELQQLFTSYSEDLGKKTNMVLQRMLSSPRYQQVFPNTTISEQNSVTMSGRWLRNSEVMEFVGWAGSFRNTTIEGQITGKGLDLGAIDDPIKGRAEANSPTIRNRVWNWLTNDFFTRFSEHAGFIMTLTRWHVDDPAARFMERFPAIRVLRYPALWRRDEAGRLVGDIEAGQPLFPELKSREFLMERRQLLSLADFESIYQQNPYVSGGGMFPIDKFPLLESVNRALIARSVRYWDKAGTTKEDGGAAHTCGVLMHEMRPQVEPQWVVEDVRRGRWSALTRERMIKQVADLDRAAYGYGRVTQAIEQEPGSGGKESAEATVRQLRGHTTFTDRVTGDKVERARPYAAQVEAGNVGLVAGPWVRNFLDEHEVAPSGPTKDQWDAASGAFARLTVGSKYDPSMSWVA
jgi:predicted phage terminase large subunit-like protein